MGKRGNTKSFEKAARGQKQQQVWPYGDHIRKGTLATPPFRRQSRPGSSPGRRVYLVHFKCFILPLSLLISEGNLNLLQKVEVEEFS